jgi:hypothetical protein
MCQRPCTPFIVCPLVSLVLGADHHPVLKVVRKLVNATPSTELVDAYLTEIAKAYGVEWSPLPAYSADDETDEAADGGVRVRFTVKLRV